MIKKRLCDVCGKAIPADKHHSSLRCSKACAEEGKRRRRVERHKERLADPVEKAKLEAIHARQVARMSARTHRLRDAGLCVQCGKRKTGGMSLCPDCNDHRKEWREGRARRRYLRRQCSECGIGGLPIGEAQCAPCLEKRRRLERDRRKRRIDAGVCYKCGEAPSAPGSPQCEPCRKIATARTIALQNSRRERGLCVACALPAAEGHAMCAGCLKKDRDKKSARVAAGFCRTCGKKRDREGSNCVACITIYRAYIKDRPRDRSPVEEDDPDIYTDGGTSNPLLEGIEWVR